MVRRRARLSPLPDDARSWLRARGPAARLPRDMWALGAALASSRRPRGSVHERSLPAGTDWRRPAERGLAELIGSLAPNTILFAVSARGTGDAHELIERHGEASL